MEIWIEGHRATGDSSNAQYLGNYEGETFKDACKNAIEDLDMDMSYYDENNNSYWGCRFFDNEMAARASFG